MRISDWSSDVCSSDLWVSTYTKALQRQLGHETARVYPDPAVRRARVVTRKGRENYLCLLNLEDALQGGFAGRAAILAQLVARSEERRVGEECVSTCKSRWSRYH